MKRKNMDDQRSYFQQAFSYLGDLLLNTGDQSNSVNQTASHAPPADVDEEMTDDTIPRPPTAATIKDTTSANIADTSIYRTTSNIDSLRQMLPPPNPPPHRRKPRQESVLDKRDRVKRSEKVRRLIGQLMPHEEARAHGYSGSTKALHGFQDYLLAVKAQMEKTEQAYANRRTSMSSAMNVSSFAHFGSSVHAESVIMDDSMSITSEVSENIVNRKFMPVQPLRKEQDWIKVLRLRAQGLAVPEVIPADTPTPAFDKLQAKKKAFEDNLTQLQSGKDNFPKITAEMMSVITGAINLRSGDIVSGFKLTIKPHDMETLTKRNWLNDEIINFYYSLIMDRSEKNEKLPKVFIFNSFFYSMLVNDGYDRVKRWTKKIDIFAKDLMILPIHLGNHWCCACIDFRRKRIEYFDSLHGRNSQIFPCLVAYLTRESKEKNKDFVESEWVTHDPKNIPAQENGYDCGVFSCTFAEYLSRREEFDFEQSHMPYLRKRMVYEIVSKKLMLE